ncbi:MAG TPA: bacillithiol system redox-active protein YtxJ [Gemmatimonadaceae bacterium]|nr:bacillithiol system redox-active protein YtxJ [Gemmatimonadaceae bacterium]
MRDLTSPDELDALLREPEVVLLKHGAHCPISANARDELARLEKSRPDTPVYGVEVTSSRALSNDLAQRLGVRHESPQAFVLREGRVAWKATHLNITAEALGEQLGR